MGLRYNRKAKFSNVDPKHYRNSPSGIECIEVVRHLNFNRGNAMKYIWRAGDKGDELEDLKKAIWYINDEIKRIEHVRSKNKTANRISRKRRTHSNLVQRPGKRRKS